MKGTVFLLAAVALATASVLIPYLFLKDIASFWASFFFWCALTLAVIIAAAVYMRSWGKGV